MPVGSLVDACDLAEPVQRFVRRQVSPDAVFDELVRHECRKVRHVDVSLEEGPLQNGGGGLKKSSNVASGKLDATPEGAAAVLLDLLLEKHPATPPYPAPLALDDDDYDENSVFSPSPKFRSSLSSSESVP